MRRKVCVTCSVVCRLCLSYCLFLALLGEDLAEHAGRFWASEDAVEARGIDHCDRAVGMGMAEVKKKRLTMASSESAHTPAQVSLKKLWTV